MIIEVEGARITDPLQIRNEFQKHMKALLGTQVQAKKFDPAALYREEQPDLSQLQEPFTSLEIHNAVKQLANNKASGPDGLPHEFFKNFWQFLKRDVEGIFDQFWSGNLDLVNLNKASIVMIPKKTNSTSVGDYRPISIINLIPKLITKVLSNRLRLILPELVSSQQTAFTRDRHIAENFLATREILQHVTSSGRKAIFAKIDFAKAFDSIDWAFLLDVMRARGFPTRWIGWIQTILASSQSRIVINGEHSEYFTHKRGLRQGDPISPMLFIIAVDVFQRMIHVANNLLHEPLSGRCSQPIYALQYADDTAVIANASARTLITFKLVLRMFSNISGLKVNYEKSSFVPFNLDRRSVWETKLILMFKQASMPIDYLGMPLTVNRPRRSDFLPLIEKLERRMEGWKGKLISRGGRLQLVKSVLSAIPIYYMMCFKLPKWVIDRLDAIRRAFLWGRNDKEGRAISLLNWPTVCKPVRIGGMGIHDLAVHNVALLLRWWWRAYTSPTSLWTTTITVLKWTGLYEAGPSFWMVSGSFFWKALIRLLPIFRWSTEWKIGTGEAISFWFDAWQGQPLIKLLEPGGRPTQPKISLRDAAPIVTTLLPESDLTVTLNSGCDSILWKWTASGIYSANSVYKMLTTGGRIEFDHMYVWRLPIPPTVRIFAYLMLQDRILTGEVMERRNMATQNRCVMCRNCPSESTLHLLFLCPNAVQVWFRVAAHFGFRIMVPRLTVDDIMVVSRRQAEMEGERCRKIWNSLFMCTCWLIWKQRNNKIFTGKLTPPDIVASRVIEETLLWMKCCNQGVLQKSCNLIEEPD